MEAKTEIDNEYRSAGSDRQGPFRMAGRNLMRLFQLFLLYARMDILWITRDLKLFLSYVLSDMLINIGALLGMLLLAERFAGIGPWTKMQVVFLLGYIAVSSGLLDTFFNYNVAFISRRIGRGQMDHVLVQPQAMWMALLTEGFCPFSGSVVMLPGIVLLAGAIPRLSLHLSPFWLFALLLNLFASAAISLAFQYSWGSLAFWSPRGAEEINSSTSRLLRQLKPFPLDGLSSPLIGSLLTLLPIGFLGWLPCRALLGIDRAAWHLWITPFAAVGFCLLAAIIFRKGLQQYGRVGSQRYSRLGHRS